jgi:hypothetical protein
MASFDLKRAVVTAACGASFAWLSPRNAPPEDGPTSNAHVREVRRHHAESPVAIESLHDWRPRLVAPLPRPRNLFAFGAAVPKHDVAEKPPVDSAPPEVTPALPPAPPALKLVGLAEDTGPSEPTRTAIISGAGQLFVVTEGDAVTSRYRVASVSPGMVDLTDLQTGGTLRLVFN